MKFDYNKLTPRSLKLENGIPLYLFPDLSMDVVRIEFIYEAGGYFQTKPLQAQACSSLLEATRSTSATEMNEKFDQYGAYVEKYTDRDQVSIIIYVLKRYATQVVHLCEEVFKEPLFTPSELELYLQKGLSRFEVSMQKVSEISRRAFYQNVFGVQHPYGRCVEREDYAKLKAEDLQSFYQQYYVAENAGIVLSGGFGEDVIAAVEKSFGQGILRGEASCLDAKKEDLPLSTSEFFPKEGAVQASVRMGKIVMLPTSEDFAQFKVLDYVFGGYFGSRIMKNIREEKGYTYGISSYLVPMRFYTVWMISSEVKQACSEQVMSEIEKEMDKLCSRKISDKELDLVRNVYAGDFLREMDGTFDQSEKWKFLRTFHLDGDFYRQFTEVMTHITPEEIRFTAQKYFDPKTLHRVWAGA